MAISADLKAKLRKEIPDQAGHFTWAAVTFLGFCYAWQGALPWWGRLTVFCGALLSLLAIVGRECWQKRDERPYGIFSNFPWLDATFFMSGAVAGTVGGVVWF